MTPRFAVGRERLALAALAAAALALWALAPTYPNYDSYYALVWGREVLDGLSPSFEAYAAPTQHPLWIGVGALASLLGDDGDRALVLVSVLSLVALIAGVYRLGGACFGRWPGLAAAGFVGSSFAFLLLAARGYLDVPFLALVVWAAVLMAPGARPRPVAAMTLLALAGLLRPEAWILAALLWLWRIRRASARERALLTALAASAPVLWALTDLVVTGDPLFSLNSTSELAEDLGRDRGVGDLPRSFVSFLADTVRTPVAALALAGGALALASPARRRAGLPLALFAAGAVTFLGTGLAGLSILPRYLTVPAVALCLFAGYALLAWTTLPDSHPWRARLRAGSAVALVGGVAFAITQTGALDRLTDELRFIEGTHDDLTALLATPAVQSGLRCGPLTMPTFRLVPDARWILDAPRERVGARSARRRDTGVAVFMLGSKTLRRFGFADGTSPRVNVPDPGFVRAVRVGRFAAYVSCPGR